MSLFKNRNAENQKTGSIYLRYTCLFLLFSLFIVAYFLINGKTNINIASDGMNQHYRAMLYYSKYLKEIFINLINEHRLIMPHWDFTIGEGADIISTLHSDAVGDPLTFLSVLIPERFMPAYYMFNTFIRVYLGGLFFIKLCLYLGKNNQYAILAGAMVYDFCFWSLESISHHIYFLTPLMYLPLLILGVEKIINDDEPFTFVFAVMLGSISWLYFFYMEAAATAIYGTVRLFCRYKSDIKTIFKKLVIIVLHVLLGLGLGALVLAPMVYNYMNDNRMGIENVVSLLYPRFFYERLLTIFVSNDSTYDLCMGFAAPTLFALALSFRNIKKNFCLCILNLITFISVCLPICGKILNGFSFVSQRWSFIIALPVAYTLVDQWDKFKNNRKYLSIIMVMLLALSVYSAWSRNERVFIPMFFCIVFLFVSTSDIEKRVSGFDLRQVIMVALLMINSLYIEQYSLSPRGGNVLKDLLSIEEAKKLPTSSEAQIMKEYLSDKNDGFYRYTGNRLTNNAAMTIGTNSTAFYWSITNASDQIFRLKLGMQDFICWQIFGYDNRAELESLANVRYYIAKESYEDVIPYGFELVDNIDGYNIYMNNYALPFGYTYDEAVSYEYWDSLNALQKQQLMMKAAIIDTERSDSVDISEIEKTDYEIICGDGISINGNVIDVAEENAALTIRFNGEEGKEHYVIFSGLDYEDIYNVIEDDHSSSAIILDSADGSRNIFSYLTKSHHYYFGKSDYVGYFGNKKIDEISMSFSLIGKYTFDEFGVYLKDMDTYEGYINDLSKDHLENVVFEANQVSGDIELDDDKYLDVSIPYSKGWKAYVDGKETEILQMNQHHLGLYLEPGRHHIEFRYHSPGLKAGALVSAVSFVTLILYYSLYRKKHLS